MSSDPHSPRQEGPEPGRVQPESTGPYCPPSEGTSTVIGPYKLLQQIGEGGFGVVHMAEQDRPVHRRVAVKVIKPGMDSKQVIARFEAERQALALMDHQNIAKVFDAGTTDSGRPYFVMELVHGVHITKYCDDNHLTVRERLELFGPVCKAIQHAHQKGIIHRDLKPSNVLVCLYDGQPVPKVIDFGVAKATDQRLTERTMFTEYGQMVGTFEYMAPEQAEMNQLGVDTRGDIYSLGVMLYELLTGSTPLQRLRLQRAGLAEVLKIIQEEEPPRPSTRLSTSAKAGKIAAARRTEPVKLGKLLRGELDWVVMKCLEKDRVRRYESANGLARDIERYLHDEPVEAGPPGAGYRLRKLARKYRTALGVAGLFVTLLVLAVAVSGWQAVRAVRAERQALAERDRAEQEKGRAEAGFRMAQDTVDRFFTQVGESPQLKAHGMEKFRKEMLQNAREFYERFIREQLDAPEARHDLGLAHFRLARVLRVLGDYAGTQGLSQKAIEILGDLARAHPDVAEYQSDLAASHYLLGAVYFDADRRDKAEAAYQQALAIQEDLADTHPEVPEYARALAATEIDLGVLHRRAGRLDKAQASLEQAVRILSRLVTNNPSAAEQELFAAAQMELGATYTQSSLTEKAEAPLKGAVHMCEALVRDYPEVPEYRFLLGKTVLVLGNLYSDNLGQTAKGQAADKQALEIFEKLAEEHPDVLEYVYNVGRCYTWLALDERRAGRLDAAVTCYDKAVEILGRVVGRGYGQGQSDLTDARVCRAIVRAERGDHTHASAEAEAVGRQATLSQYNCYNIACAFAKASVAAEKDAKLAAAERSGLKTQYADRAMDFLHQAVAKGLRNAAAMKGDTDLMPLRAREDFQKLTQEVEQKTKE